VAAVPIISQSRIKKKEKVEPRAIMWLEGFGQFKIQ
jgi:hypothetical protein